MKYLFMLMLLMASGTAAAQSVLTAWPSLPLTFRSQISNDGLFVKGIGVDTWYALEVDPSTGELPVTGSFSFSGLLDEDHNYGTVGADTLRTAAQIGNATGAADFGQGAVSAQTLRTVSVLSNGAAGLAYGAGTTGSTVLRVVLPTDQSAIPVTQSTSPWVSNLTQVGGAALSLGQTTESASLPVTIASNQTAIPVSPTAQTGRTVFKTFTQSYSSSNVLTSAFTTVVSATTAPINELDIFDSSGGDYYLAYAGTCGALSTTTNAIIISPGGGGKDFAIPSGNCVGIQAKTANLTSGIVNMTLYE